MRCSPPSRDGWTASHVRVRRDRRREPKSLLCRCLSASPLSAVLFELWFEDIVVPSNLVTGDREFEGASKHPDDDKYIAAAIEVRAGFVVAGDSDLLDL